MLSIEGSIFWGEVDTAQEGFWKYGLVSFLSDSSKVEPERSVSHCLWE